MLDLRPVFKKELTIAEFCAPLTQDDLRRFTNEMIDRIQELIADAVDADVTFVPVDPDAYDSYASSDEDLNIAWTLGHVIVHANAGSEEWAFTAAELARGVENHGRSRYEVPWEEVTSIAQCRHLLEDSRRMRLATLDVWPSTPHMDNTMTVPFLEGPINPTAAYLVGLGHESSHLGQIEEIMRQARAAR